MRDRLRTTFAICASLFAMSDPSLAAVAPPAALVVIEPFARAPAYPYDGLIPGQTPNQDVPFLDGPPEARFHISPRGGKMMAATTYSDPRSLLAIPAQFDPAAPDAALVVFFHGNLATLQRDVRLRQGVPRQLFASGLNAALVAPQLAVNALDSSPGHFYEPDFFTKYIYEAEDHLQTLSHGRFDRATLAKLPIIIVAYSGGYLATAFTLHHAQPGSRIRGVILLDALFGESAKFEDWVERTHPHTFFLSAFSKASAAKNAALETALAAHGVLPRSSLPRQLAPGDVVFMSATEAVHNDFVTRSWVADPLRALLACVQIDARVPARETCSGGAIDDNAAMKRAVVLPVPRLDHAGARPSACPVDAPDCDPLAGRPLDAK